MLNVGSPFGGIATDLMQSIFRTIAAAFIHFMTSILTLINSSASNVLDLAIVKNTILFSQALAISLLVLKILYEVLFNQILQANGDQHMAPGQLLIGIVKSVAVITSVPWIVQWLYKFGTTLSVDVNNIQSEQAPSSLNSAFMNAINDNPLVLSIGIIVAVIMLIVVILQSFRRAADLALIAVSGAIMATGLVTNSSMYKSWWQELIAVSFTQAAQIFMVKVAFVAFMVANINVPGANVLLFIGFLWAALQTPNVIKKWSSSTGLGRGAMQSAQSAISTQIMKRAFTKGA